MAGIVAVLTIRNKAAVTDQTRVNGTFKLFLCISDNKVS